MNNQTPMAVWRAGMDKIEAAARAVDMPLRLDNANALPTYPLWGTGPMSEFPPFDRLLNGVFRQYLDRALPLRTRAETRRLRFANE